MKKVVFVLLLSVLSLGAFAQQGTIDGHAKIGLQTDPGRFAIGAEARYYITDNIRGAVDAVVLLPKDKVLGLDFNINAHYVFRVLDNKLGVYPLAGLAIANNRAKYDGYKNGPIEVEGFTVKTTDFGFNIGAGVDYDLSESTYVNAEFKYTFCDWDHAMFTVGYGLKF